MQNISTKSSKSVEEVKINDLNCTNISQWQFYTDELTNYKEHREYLYILNHKEKH